MASEPKPAEDEPAQAFVDPGDALCWAVGIVHYDSWDDLGHCLDALARQQPVLRTVRVYDVAVGTDVAVGAGVDARRARPAANAASERRRALAAAHPEVEWLDGPNVGFAAAANTLLRAELSAPEPAALQMIMNADVALDRDHLARLGELFASEQRVAIAGGKLLRPGRALIDSAGIRLPAHARPRDRGSEREDDGRFDSAEDVFGVSGAAMALRTAALGALALDGEVFDEDFFMYHEDTDLCWRAHVLGWRVRYEPAAVAVHRRGWRKQERFATPAWIRRHSFKNHYLQLVKNATAAGLVARAPALIAWEILRLGFVILRDREMWPAYGEAWRGLPDAWRKRRLLRAQVRPG